MKTFVDFHKVDEHHKEIHQRLLNWASWVQVHSGGKIHPMWKNARSNAWQWHTPEHRETCDILDAQKMEKEVSKLPPDERTAIRWMYVFRNHPKAACRNLQVDAPGLMRLCRAARSKLAHICTDCLPESVSDNTTNRREYA